MSYGLVACVPVFPPHAGEVQRDGGWNHTVLLRNAAGAWPGHTLVGLRTRLWSTSLTVARVSRSLENRIIVRTENVTLMLSDQQGELV